MKKRPPGSDADDFANAQTAGMAIAILVIVGWLIFGWLSSCSWHSESFEQETARKNAALQADIETGCNHWVRWFAWYPVRVGGPLSGTEMVWLKPVEQHVSWIWCRSPDWVWWRFRDYAYREIGSTYEEN